MACQANVRSDLESIGNQHQRGVRRRTGSVQVPLLSSHPAPQQQQGTGQLRSPSCPGEEPSCRLLPAGVVGPLVGVYLAVSCRPEEELAPPEGIRRPYSSETPAMEAKDTKGVT